jgi:hypothetical protein
MRFQMAVQIPNGQMFGHSIQRNKDGFHHGTLHK